jgi:hypothetical protein
VESIFLKKEGATPKNRILDFLIVSQEFDYSLRDIARFSRVGYTTLKKLKNELVKEKWIVLTRTIGRAKMYKLNVSNNKVKKFIDFYWSVVEPETEEQTKVEHVTTGRVGIPVSARSL